MRHKTGKGEEREMVRQGKKQSKAGGEMEKREEEEDKRKGKKE